MSNKPDHCYEIRPIHFIILLVMLLCIMLAANYILPSNEEKISNALTQRGYDVADISFTPNNILSRIYKSSRPIQLDDNYVCEYWEIQIIGTTGFVSHVVPYPNKKWPEPPETIDITINFSPVEYERIKEKAGNNSVEEYIKDIIKNTDSLQIK